MVETICFSARLKKGLRMKRHDPFDIMVTAFLMGKFHTRILICVFESTTNIHCDDKDSKHCEEQQPRTLIPSKQDCRGRASSSYSVLSHP